MAARFAAACAVAFEGSTLPRAEVTGAPVRRVDPCTSTGSTGRDDARVALGLPADRFVVAVIGGSLGSGVLNEAIRRVRRRPTPTTPASPCTTSWARARRRRRDRGRDDAGRRALPLVGFEDRMDLLYAAADVLVGRGGATTVAEVAVTGTPAILVPWSGAAEDHQTANVRWLVRPGRGHRSCPRATSTASARSSTSCGPTSCGATPSAIGRVAAGRSHRSERIPHMIERVALASNAS